MVSRARAAGPRLGGDHGGYSERRLIAGLSRLAALSLRAARAAREGAGTAARGPDATPGPGWSAGAGRYGGVLGRQAGHQVGQLGEVPHAVVREARAGVWPLHEDGGEAKGARRREVVVGVGRDVPPGR